ncbi:unnamed protein product [Aureobasidium mustum]|uniref:DUF7029 domain-containing protein n=1 Tax=Aureobasidium mustum TaxID=2773714 RepID=A0A9N8K6T4_9PEZI|nr:unnamed protein product [Aureobasidium mustum]
MLHSLRFLFLLPASVVLASPILAHTTKITEKTFYPIADTTIDQYGESQLMPHYSGALLYFEKPATTPSMSTAFDTTHPMVILENSARIDYSCDTSNSRLAVRAFDDESMDLIRSWPDDLVVVTNKVSCNSNDERGIFLITGREESEDSTRDGMEPLIFHLSRKELKDVATTVHVAYLDSVFDQHNSTPLKTQ